MHVDNEEIYDNLIQAEWRLAFLRASGFTQAIITNHFVTHNDLTKQSYRVSWHSEPREVTPITLEEVETDDPETGHELGGEA